MKRLFFLTALASALLASSASAGPDDDAAAALAIAAAARPLTPPICACTGPGDCKVCGSKCSCPQCIAAPPAGLKWLRYSDGDVSCVSLWDEKNHRQVGAYSFAWKAYRPGGDGHFGAPSPCPLPTPLSIDEVPAFPPPPVVRAAPIQAMPMYQPSFSGFSGRGCST